ncbi:phosphoribosylamine--glycine ligase [Galactobacter caseinivorans]|uniref:Multifunctional fusion protein n=1 Tax=Galactobacter caseinivorans TaxID=2676123 RepID=A0A496PN68_9MICC|nr:phosphoribosylamine--glycine ligase [Galactobacter caseinivorans]RKW71929.1 phosphoribosylamine--glycine ligase [Galactobacter caseinivorans]
MKVLVIGPGGREHALVRSLLADPSVTEVHAAPGNAGIGAEVRLHPLNTSDPVAATALARELAVDLVVVGPEAPLAAGVADALREAGFDVFGPSKEAAKLEASKAFAKQIMAEAEVPTAMARIATNAEEAADALDSFGAPHVVKDDGLAAGKGVVVTSDRAEALAHAEACFAAGGTVVIEEFLDGPEVSVFVLADGTNAVALSPAQDFKRIFDHDQGPNTGGMGAYTPLNWLPEGFVDEVMERVAMPTLRAMARRGTPFVGVLYCGLALTSRGLRVIEFNARFGDPETQPVLARLKTPLGRVLRAAARGELDTVGPLRWDERTAVAVVLASHGYPGTVRTGDVITGVEDAEALDAVSVLHAGTATNAAGELVSAGGRVLAVVALGQDLGAARELAYAGVGRIRLEGSQHRTDIALKAARGVQTAAPALPGWRHVYSGKVRDLYEPQDPAITDRVLVVASDRISAYDRVLSTQIPDKGAVLTQLSLWWFEQLAGIPNHVISTDVPEAVRGRAMVCKRLEMYPIECIARGYLTGSGLAEYRVDGTVSAQPLPAGLVDGSRLDPAIFTPSAKAEVGEHDENITFEEMAQRVGLPLSEQLSELTLQVYTAAEAIARERGVILADTKVEFGLDPVTGTVTLGDEVLTPDSSRFWDAQLYQPGQAQPSFDKQYVRDWLTSPESGWDKDSGQEPPALPADVVERTRARYVEAYERLTGRTFTA